MARKPKTIAAAEQIENAETTPQETEPKNPRTAGLAPAWKPGQSGNPAGRPKGSRNKFGEAFIDDFYTDWMEHGKAAIRTMREERPHEYVKAAVAILPKQVDVTVSPLQEMNDDQLDARIRQLAQLLEIGVGGNADGEAAPAQPKPSRLI